MYKLTAQVEHSGNDIVSVDSTCDNRELPRRQLQLLGLSPCVGVYQADLFDKAVKSVF